MPLLRSLEKSIATECYKDFAPSGAVAVPLLNPNGIPATPKVGAQLLPWEIGLNNVNEVVAFVMTCCAATPLELVLERG